MNRKTLVNIANNILKQNPDPVVKHILIKNFLKEKNNEYLYQSKCYRQLKEEQNSNGSWGRFHSENTKINSIFRTTEKAIDRCISIGIGKNDPILKKAKNYMERLLKKEEKIQDWSEKNDRWETGVEMFIAGTLSLVDPENPILDDIFKKWLQITQIAFKSGQYQHGDDKQAHKVINGISCEIQYLALNNKYAISILAGRSKEIQADLRKKLIKWIWNKEKGIGYLRDFQLCSFHKVDDKYIVDTWFNAIDIISNFKTWKVVCKDFIDYLINRKTNNSLWDFGKRATQNIIFPLSENWKKKKNRIFDYSTKVLLLLDKYFSSE